jgi:hypothetical protein
LPGITSLVVAVIAATIGGTLGVVKFFNRKASRNDTLLEKAARSGRPIHLEAILTKVPPEFEGRVDRVEKAVVGLVTEQKEASDKATERYEHLATLIGETNTAIAHIQGALSAAAKPKHE